MSETATPKKQLSSVLHPDNPWFSKRPLNQHCRTSLMMLLTDTLSISLVSLVTLVNTDLFEYPKYKDYIVAPTKENIAAYEQFLVETLAKATALNQTNFTAVQKSDYTALVEFIEVEKLRLSLWSFELPTNHMFLPMLSIEVGRSSAMENVTDFENYKKRLFCLPAFIDAMIDGFRAGMDAKVTLPSESIQGMIEYCSSCTEDASNSSFLNVEKIKKTGSNPEEIVSIIRFYVNPAFLKLQTFLREEYIHHARQSAGIHGLPDAKRFYSDMIYFSTSVRYTPDELHQLGLEEVERIAKRMEETKSKVFEGTFGEFRKALDEGKFPEYKLQKPEDAVDHYKSLVTEINKIMPKYFNKFPKFECNVVACPPSSEGNAPMAFYLPGTSTEAGAFMTNLKLAGSKGMQQAMALTLHEAIPGHHHQISLDLESTGKHLIHKMTFQTAYAEGWGLYSEYLGEEMGMYKDAISLYGRLELEMHRALRLVVDTGLHAKGWTIEQSIEYISKYHILSHDETVSEVKRYAIMPGQALAYKVGEIQIRKLRKEAEEALGSQFDIKAFHDVVLDHGSVTMETLAFNVREWIKEELKKPSLQRLMDKILDIFFEESGLFAEMYEYNKYPDTLYRRSKKMIEDQMAALRAVVAEAKSYDHTKFTEKEKQDFLAIEQVMQHMEIEDKCWSLEIPISHLSVSHMPMALTRIQQINNPTDYANYQKRLRIFEHLIGDYIEGFKAGLAAGVTLPLESIELIISGCNQLSTCELDQSPFLCGDKIKAAGLDVEEAKAIIRDVVNPAYQRFVAFMEQEYRQHARKHAGIFGLKDAEKVYADTIYLHTSVRYTPDELHNLGLQEVERIAKRMEETKNQVFEGSMEEFRAALKEGSRFPQYKLEKPEDAIDFYKNTLKEINDVMPKYFNKFPKFECDIQAVPKQAEDNSPTAFYLPGTSTRAGTFMANLKLCGSAMYQAMALTLHEAIPGHHHQLSLEFEDQSRHLVHKLNFHTAYAEGWGLYSEYLGEEMGMYKDPVSLYGRLEFEMHRALRLVVDTGLHAKGWTLEQAAELMRQHLTFPEEDIQSEVKRYSIMPGQALAYKVGEIQIKKLRKEAEEALGSQFDIRSFHQVVLDHGSVSMETLAVNVREWIKEELKKPSLRRLMDKTLDVALRDVGSI
ncbi:hypothetical protein EDD86DRAFT_127098 [Gorgonomyces haynaldii]|nr:hypothetical protein EDD86DRAFT_127098 [Gorgonomyces haynaldii]